MARSTSRVASPSTCPRSSCDRAGLRAGDRLSADAAARTARAGRALPGSRAGASAPWGPRSVAAREWRCGFGRPDSIPRSVGQTVGLAGRAWAISMTGGSPRRMRAEKQRSGLGRAKDPGRAGGQGGRAIDRSTRCSDPRRTRDRAGAMEGADVLEQTVRKRFGVAVRHRSRRRPSGVWPASSRARGYDWDTIGRMARTLRAEARHEAAASASPVSPAFLDTLPRPNVNSAACDDWSTAVLRDLAFWL